MPPQPAQDPAAPAAPDGSAITSTAGGSEVTGHQVVAALKQMAEDLTAAARRNLAGARLLAASYVADLDRAQAQYEATIAGRPPSTVFTAVTRLVPETGVWLDGVWIPYPLLAGLEAQEPESAAWGSPAVIPDREQERVLVLHGLAVRETEGDLRRGDTLREFISSLIIPERADQS